MEKNIISITGQALVTVTYNYEIKDLEKFNQIIKQRREDLVDIADMYNEILQYDNEYVKFIDTDFDSVEEDSCYLEINPSSNAVETIIKENKLDELEEWYN
jgi:uncharacterized protein YfdQ (DUF2303 family)